jgi:hypothetical protein
LSDAESLDEPRTAAIRPETSDASRRIALSYSVIPAKAGIQPFDAIEEAGIDLLRFWNENGFRPSPE